MTHPPDAGLISRLIEAFLEAFFRRTDFAKLIESE